MPIRLTLVCHAATASTRDVAFPADEPVEARSLARLTAAPWAPRADRAWTSPALRARQTAAALGLVDAAVEPALRDCDYGRWTGCSYAAIQAGEPDAVAAWLSDPDAAPHGGETLSGVMARTAAWLGAMEGGRIVAVTHAAVIRAALLHALGAPAASFWRIDVAPLTVARLSGNGGRWTLGRLGPVAARG